MYPLDSPDDLSQMIFNLEQTNDRPLDIPVIRNKIITFLESKKQKPHRQVMTEEEQDERILIEDYLQFNPSPKPIVTSPWKKQKIASTGVGISKNSSC